MGGTLGDKDNPPDRRGIGPASWTAPARLPRFGPADSRKLPSPSPGQAADGAGAFFL